MAPSGLNPESEDFQQSRPSFFIGQHDSLRVDALTDDQYTQVLNTGFGFTTVPITNSHFQERVVSLYKSHIQKSEELGLSGSNNASLPGPVVPTLTDEDTSLFPSTYVGNLVAYSSPWIDLCSLNPLIASVSRQVLNLEIAYANFCGVRSVIIPGPRRDGPSKQVAQYARAIQETLLVASRVNIIIHMPMYREPGLEEKAEDLSTLIDGNKTAEDEKEPIDLFGVWDTWNTIRSACNYTIRLFVALKLPRRLPEKELQTRWFAEPLHYLSLGPQTFHDNKAGFPSLTRYHQDLIHSYMRLKTAPWFILYDVGPTVAELDAISASVEQVMAAYPTLAEAHSSDFQKSQDSTPQSNAYVSYMRFVERQQQPLSLLDSTTLTSFQDWLQSPLQPLSDNLESATYEMFEGDPVKYDLYEKAITEAMAEWKELKKPVSFNPSGSEPALVVAVAGAGRGPLVTRAIRASEKTGTNVQFWALEKNQNAYVYLLRQNKREWSGKVRVVKTDMRDWPGPVTESNNDPATAKVDILITELLGSFGDNELSPECLDGIQKHIARPHGISIPHSYTAWLSPISTPRLYTDISSRTVGDPNAFETPWVVRLFALDFVSQKVPDHARFQQAWEFIHPVPRTLIEDWEKRHGDPAPRLRTAGAGAMHGSGGVNEHNARHCHLTFYCRPRGVIHGLAGYFESTLYASQTGGDKDLVELSTLPEQIDKKSKDMISWFPIFFPLRQPLYFPQDSELEVSMWRQTDDTQVWYEWLVEAYTWTGPKQRVKIGGTELHSSRKVACLM